MIDPREIIIDHVNPFEKKEMNIGIRLIRSPTHGLGNILGDEFEDFGFGMPVSSD